MKHFRQLVKELPAKKVVFAFGRYQPPTTGHGLLVAAVKHVAQKQGADHVIYASATQDKKQNPLPVDRKVYYLKRMFPGTNFVAADANVRTFIEAIKQLNKKYKNLVMIAGSDRVPEYKKLLDKYNGKEFHYDTIEVVSAGERDPDSDSAAGMSGTKMRDAAKKGDFELFKKGLPSTLTTVDAKRLMNEIREGLGLEVIREKVELEKDNIREAYHAGNIFNVDDIVESAGVVYKIKKRGSNHLLLLDECGNLVSKWLQDVAQTDKEFTLLEGLTEMKFTGTDKVKVARVIANALGVADVEKSTNPEQLINNALRKIRSKPMRPEYIDVLHKMLATAQEAGIAYDEKLVPQKAQVEEGVKQPNGTDKVGGIIAELSPETLKSYIPKAMGSKSAADFTRGVKMAQGSGGEDELRKKSEKRSSGIHTAIKKLTKEELEEGAAKKQYGTGWMLRADPELKKKVDSQVKGVKALQKSAAKKEVKEDISIDEGKMGELHATISKHLDKHISDFKSGHTGMDQFGGKVLAAHKSVAKEHGLEHKHAAKFVNDYVDSKLNEEALSEGVKSKLAAAALAATMAVHPAPAKSAPSVAGVIASQTAARHAAAAREKSSDYAKNQKPITWSDIYDKIKDKVTGKEVKKEETDLNEVSDQTLDKAWHGRYQQALAAKRGSPEHQKAHKSMGKIGDVMLKRTQSKLTHMAKHDPEAYKKSAVASADQDRKRGWSTEETETVADLLEQLATAAMMGRDTEILKKKLSQLRHDVKNNESDQEAERQVEPIEKKIGHTVTSPVETDTTRRMKVRHMTEETVDENWVKKTINGVTHYYDKVTGQQVKREEVDLEEDQATAEYKVKTYYDNALGKTVTRKVRPHKVTFSGSKKNAEPEVDQPGEDLKNEAFANTIIPGTDISTKNKVKEGIDGVPAGDMGALPVGAPDAYSADASVITKDLKDKLRDKKALKLKEEHEDDHEELSDAELDDMADTVDELDDIIDAYDDDELHIVDEHGECVEEIKEEVISEALSRTERIRAKIRFAQSKSKRERKLQIALKTPSSVSKLNSRARKLAVKLMKQRIARKPLDKLSVSEKERVEAIVAKRKKVIDRLAMKLVSRVKKIEQNRLHKGK